MIRLETVPDVRLGNQNDESVYLLLEDPHGELDAYIEKNFSSELRRICKMPSAILNRECYGGYYPNWAELPFPKINQIVVPTGVTRWSYGLLLADQPRMQKVYELASANQGIMNLCYGANDSTDEEFILTVSLLDPIPVSNPSAVSMSEQQQRLWIIPVVDQRYWFQFVDSGNLAATLADYQDSLVATTNLTPSALVNELFDLLQAGTPRFAYMTANVTPSYMKRTPRVVWDNNYSNLALITETVLAHYGLTLVPDMHPPDNVTRFVAMDTQNSVFVHDAALQGLVGLQNCVWNGSSPPGLSTNMAAGSRFVGTPVVTAGGQIPQLAYILPNGVYVQQILDGTSNRFSSLLTATSLGFSFRTMDMLNTRIMTDFIMSEVAMTSAMRTEIAKDFYRHFSKRFDYQFAGVQIWQQTSYDDFTVYRQSWNRDTGQYDVMTRAISRIPGDLGFWDQRENIVVQANNPVTEIAQTADYNGATNTGYVNVLRDDGSGNLRPNPIESSFEKVFLENRFTLIAVPDAKSGEATWRSNLGEWRPTTWDCPAG